MKRKVIYLAMGVLSLCSTMILIMIFQQKLSQGFYKPHYSQREGFHLNRTLMLYGVEIDLLKKRSYSQAEPLNYLNLYKNPCWIEHLPKNFMKLYEKTRFFNIYGKPFVNKVSKVYTKRKNSSDPWRLRCLPYIYIAGVTKSGTTDFFEVLLRHPNVFGPWVKETMYWNRERYPHGVTVHKKLEVKHTLFDQFVSNFDYAAHHINMSRGMTTNDTTCQPIIIDGSSYLIWEDNGWPDNPGNTGLREPVYTTAMALYAAQPQAKIIVLLREPAQRLYSAFTMYRGRSDSPQKFHDAVQKAIKAYTNCSLHSTWRACFYDVPMYNQHFPVTLKASMYSIFLRDWLNVFPRHQVMVIKSEDYYSDRMLTMNDVLSFLGLDSLSVKLATKMQHKKASYKRKYQPMWNITRQILKVFYKPFNKDLEILLERKFWN